MIGDMIVHSHCNKIKLLCEHIVICKYFYFILFRSLIVQVTGYVTLVSSMHAAFSFLVLQLFLVDSSCLFFLNVKPIINSSIPLGMWPWRLPFYFYFLNPHKIPVRMKNTPFWILGLQRRVTYHQARTLNLASNIILKVLLHSSGVKSGKNAI